ATGRRAWPGGGGAASGRPTPPHWLRHELLRHPRDRLLRHHDVDLPLPAPGPGRADPGNPQRRAHHAFRDPGLHLHRHRQRGHADPGRDDRGRGRRGLAGRGCGVPLEQGPRAAWNGFRAAGRGRTHVDDAARAGSAGGTALALTGERLAIGIAVNFVLGALMTLGIGLYAPCMILVSLLVMDPKAAFPIMMGSCAFLMPVGSMRFIREGRYSLTASVGLALGGIPAVLLAAYVVRSLPLGAVRWLVIVVVVYTASSLLRT